MNRLALVTASLVAALSLTFAAPSSASVATKKDSRESLLEARANGAPREPKAGSRTASSKQQEARSSAPIRDERVDATAARCDARARDKLR
jgi:hypothetical protein